MLTDPETVELRDGARVAIRPVRPSDKDPIREGFEHLSPQSRYRRFFAPLRRLTSTDLAYLTEVDHLDHEAVVAFAGDSGEPIGVARYIRSEDPAEAEFAVAVVDHWQQRGVGTALLEQLVARARAEGIERFVAIVLGENSEALDLYDHLVPDGAPPRRSASGNLELVVELPDPGEGIGSRLARILRAAASGLVISPWRVIARGVGAATRPLR